MGSQSSAHRKSEQVLFVPIAPGPRPQRRVLASSEQLFLALSQPLGLDHPWDEDTAMLSALRRQVIRCYLLCTGLVLIGPAYADPPIDLARYHGQVIHLDFWASWCAPCRQSFPWMQTLKDTYQRQGLAVVAINLDHDRADAEQFMQRFHPDFAVQVDPQGTVAERFKVAGMPTSVIIDQHGVPRFTHIGFRPADREAYERELRVLRAEK
jgi:thiol-disulfide isomerase/thioredoxin